MSRLRQATAEARILTLTLAVLGLVCACSRASARLGPTPTAAFPTVWVDQPSSPAQIAAAGPPTTQAAPALAVPAVAPGGGPSLPPGSAAGTAPPVAPAPDGSAVVPTPAASAAPPAAEAAASAPVAGPPSAPSSVAGALPPGSSPASPTAVVDRVPVLNAMAAGEVQVTLVGVHGGEHAEVRILSTAPGPLALQLGPGRIAIQALIPNVPTETTFLLDAKDGIPFDLAPGGSVSVLVPQSGQTRIASGSVAMIRDKRAYSNANIRALSAILAPSQDPQEPLEKCSPSCLPGSACMHGSCASLCESSCAAGLVCNDEGKCGAESALAGSLEQANADSSPGAAPGTDPPRRPWNRFELEFLGGFATGSKPPIAEVETSYGFGASSTSEIRAAFGGGLGAQVTYGLSPIEWLELAGSLRGMWSKIDQGGTDAGSGNFSQWTLLGTPRLLVPVSKSAGENGGIYVMLGGGPMYAMSPKLDVDLTSIEGGSHVVLEFKNATGWQGLAGVELMGGPVGLGLRVMYESIEYELESMTADGASIPLNQVKSEFRNADGAALNFGFSVAGRL